MFLKRTIIGMVAAAAVLAPLAAAASVRVEDADIFSLSRRAEDATPAAPAAADLHAIALPEANVENPAAISQLEMPVLPDTAAQKLPKPSIETPLHRLFCVEYARARSGLAVFGDAKFWWSNAKNLYARLAQPVKDAVIVFSGTGRMRRGHVAVVTHIVSPREIRVDQANWQNRGEIDHATPVLDVSARNDWSLVRVWDMASGGFGTHVYPISGFIAKSLMRQASNE